MAFEVLSCGVRLGPMTMNGLMATRSKPGFSVSTKAQAARSASALEK